MKKLILFAAVAGLGLVSASPPETKPPEAGEARTSYPPCSRTVTDRCNQLHQRRHRAHAAARHRAAPPAAATARAARAVQHRSRHAVQRIRRAGERG